MNQADIERVLQKYIEAEIAVLDGKSVEINGQSMTMENLDKIIAGREKWERRLQQFTDARLRRPQYSLARFRR
ncbi:hypothetical protein NG99_23730 [Erwinia typographi]|uniref:Primosomal replication protein PriB/PriC domain protein n=1 Tax=Erwinia typographi TaxID=371042 RepID=A0A0A3YPF3_9GAMM|nr:hypothetical protein [Erwinia typographi]KGT87236.1 hypothetical protein NG99_23730 [Erwinia typographi]